MVRIVNVGVIAFVCSILMACVSGIPMSRAMSQCDSVQKFSDYASCIRSTYDKQGRYPNDAVIKAFYANLDEINEAFKNGKLTEAQARSAAYNAYLKTVDASNKQIKRAPYCVGLGNGDSVCS